MQKSCIITIINDPGSAAFHFKMAALHVSNSLTLSRNLSVVTNTSTKFDKLNIILILLELRPPDRRLGSICNSPDLVKIHWQIRKTSSKSECCITFNKIYDSNPILKYNLITLKGYLLLSADNSSFINCFPMNRLASYTVFEGLCSC